MRVLVVIGAGASFDCFPEHSNKPNDGSKLPLANNLFAPLGTQNAFLDEYKLMGLAGKLRSKARSKGNKFNVEAELANINAIANARADQNTLQSLFKARFYLHAVIKILSNKTIRHTASHTVYVDLLNKLKDWIEEAPNSRFVDLVVFNYDDLIEKAMEHVYSVDWYGRNDQGQLEAYYRGKNLRIYKPHGSINWGRKIINFRNLDHFSYSKKIDVFRNFNQIEMIPSFQFINPDNIESDAISKDYVPAIAVPFELKTNFDECPQFMMHEMVNAINNANKIITLGWKGSDKHFTDLLKMNAKIDEAYVVSPNGHTHLNSVFPEGKIKLIQSTFEYFAGRTDALENLLNSFK